MEAKKDLEKLCELAFERHKDFCKDWKDGKPVKYWKEGEYEVCVEYESGKVWNYKDIELPFPTWC